MACFVVCLAIVGLQFGIAVVLGERSGAVRKSSVSFGTPPKRSKRVEVVSVTTPMFGDLGGWLSKLVSIVHS